MKAYVIKSKKDGKYLSKYFNYDYADKKYKHICGTKNIINAKILKECFDTNDDFECVEITIAEGDLEQKNKHLKRLLDAKEKIETNSIKGFKKLKEENKQLKQQLEEKDKEIEELKEKLYWTENGLKLRDLLTRHQLCEEIRNYIHTNEYDQFGLEYLMDGGAILNKLDQIEKGE